MVGMCANVTTGKAPYVKLNGRRGLIRVCVALLGGLLACPASDLSAQYRANSSGRISAIQPPSSRSAMNSRGPRRRPAPPPVKKVKPKDSTVSLADLSAPKKARKAYHRGERQFSSGRTDKARKSFETAVAIYPEYPSAWYSLGRVYGKQNQAPQAKVAYENAVRADPKAWRAYAGLAELAVVARDWPRLIESTDRALQLMPLASSRLYVYNAVAKYSLGDLQGAEISAQEALERTWRRPDPKAHHVLGLVATRRGEYEHASAHLRLYIDLAPNASDVGQVRKQLAHVQAEQRKLSGDQPEFVLHPSGMLVRNESQK
jgi:tetratricopeptide (TPR) repeat protein